MDSALLLSTKNEATSQSLPQPLAIVVPMIATSVGGLAEVVIHQQSGLIIRPGNVDALAWVRQHPSEAKQMAGRSRAHVHAILTFETMIDRTEAVYTQLLAFRHRSV